MSTNTTSKVTYLSAINYALENFSMPDDIHAKFVAMKEREEKKAHPDTPKKPTKNQRENADLKNIILEMFYDGNERTAADVKAQGNESVSALSVQKISALLSQLVESHLIDRKEVKRKSYYSLHIDEVMDE